MSAWAYDLKQLSPDLSPRYELRPREEGVIIFCTTCANRTSDKTFVVLSEIVEEAKGHEERNH